MTDPIKNSGPEQQQALFEAFKMAAHGRSTETVVGAAVNLLVNAIRQAHAKREFADREWSEYAAKTRGLLMEHYDPVTGVRRNVFPFTQTISLDHVDLRDRVRGH